LTSIRGAGAARDFENEAAYGARNFDYDRFGGHRDGTC
jgi:hypothetical protein